MIRPEKQGAALWESLVSVIVHAGESRVVIDMRAVEQVPSGQRYGRQFAERLVAACSGRHREVPALAFVGGSGARFGICREYAAYCSIRNIPCSVFHTVAEAEVWVPVTEPG